ncbi:MAG: nuclear transport factor 2 family protein [Armatimonadetes bacterium]|nr:nuclear transport factor 2 family protein [Armatimonadota bacterium]
MIPTGVLEADARKQAALDLLVRYVRVVDDPRRIEEWPDLFAAEAEYLVITRENYERGLPIAVIRDDSKDRICDRLVIIKQFWGAGGRAEDHHYNAGWPRHIVGPTWVESGDAGQLLVGAHFMVWSTAAVDGSPRLLVVGEYRDVVDFATGAPKLKKKTVILDTSILQDVFVYPL